MALKDFNLLITTSRGNEEDACSEIWYLLGEIGDSAVKVDKTGITGLVAAKTAFSPFEVVEQLREILKERPYEFRYTFRVIPVEKVVRTDLREIERTAVELASKIKENESFRVTVEKRFTDTSTKDMIEAAAASIERKVDLRNPDKIILVEVVGGLTGISIIKPEQILAVMKERFQS
ncbi:MAG: THUMP domain-containing protein [Candidatus Bathyarchaeota archaeon]|nr:MAG: THUMP domain-containing protein [Candidatus Bathyarchaeota archaeon]UCD39764.1 MAG: THUMP domain-containing protein [Candidatus Bathyarchaeota archaeon]